LKQKQQEFNEQLRQINLLFDPQANNYETINFTGLYSLLDKAKKDLENNKEQLTNSQNEVQKERTKYEDLFITEPIEQRKKNLKEFKE